MEEDAIMRDTQPLPETGCFGTSLIKFELGGDLQTRRKRFLDST